MSKEQWGNASWFLFHTLAEKLKDEHISILPSLISQFSNICNNLPCVECTNHASQYINNTNIHSIHSKELFIQFLNVFHNNVNMKLDKPIFTLEECREKYSNANTNRIIEYFFNVMKMIRYGQYDMIYSRSRNKAYYDLNLYLQENFHCFHV